MHLIKSESLQFLFREKNNDGGEFIVKSLKTEKDYTFKVSRSCFKFIWYTHVFVEKGYAHFNRLGTFKNGKIFNKRDEVFTPAAEAISWVLRQVEKGQFDVLDKNVEIMHTGNCLVCGRKLTDAKSVAIGIGTICSKKQ